MPSTAEVLHRISVSASTTSDFFTPDVGPCLDLPGVLDEGVKGHFVTS